VDLLWLAAAQTVEADERRLVREVDLRTITCEPMPGSAAEVLADRREAATARFVPLMRQSPGFRAACEVFEPFGQRRSLSIFLGSASGQGTLFARLFDALDLVEVLAGAADALDAALWRPVPGIPETLGGLHGHMTLNVRFSDSRCACAALSDSAGRWFRQVILLGEGGCLRIDDASFEWISPEGETIDSHREPAALSPGALVALQARRILAGADPDDPCPDTARLLAMCEAARLSARTGEGENFHRMMEMLRRK
jgi:hypothetical protein